MKTTITISGPEETFLAILNDFNPAEGTFSVEMDDARDIPDPWEIEHAISTEISNRFDTLADVEIFRMDGRTMPDECHTVGRFLAVRRIIRKTSR